MNQKEWDKIKEQIKYRKDITNKHPKLHKIRKLILLFSLLIVPLVPLVITENFVATSTLCQWFIDVMSSWIPGVEVISYASGSPNVAALAVSLAWVAICLLFIVLLQFLLELGSKNYFIYFSIPNKLFLFYYIGLTLFLLIELGWTGHASFLYGTAALFDPNSHHNLLNTMIQSKAGLGFFTFIEIFWFLIVLLGWIMASLQVFGKLNKRSWK